MHIIHKSTQSPKTPTTHTKRVAWVSKKKTNRNRSRRKMMGRSTNQIPEKQKTPLKQQATAEAEEAAPPKRTAKDTEEEGRWNPTFPIFYYKGASYPPNKDYATKNCGGNEKTNRASTAKRKEQPITLRTKNHPAMRPRSSPSGFVGTGTLPTQIPTDKQIRADWVGWR